MAHTLTPVGILVTASLGEAATSQTVVNDFQRLLYFTDLDDVFMNLEEFAISVNYYHSSLGVWVSYPVMFDDPHASINIGGENEFNTIRPQFQISEARLKHRILKKDRCKINGIEYRVEDFISDGVGISTIYLRMK